MSVRDQRKPAAFRLDGGKAKDVKIVLGHVAPTPQMSADAAKELRGLGERVSRWCR